VIDDVDYFVRGVLLIPIVGTEERFGFGVWTTLSQANFERFVELGGTLGPEPCGPFFGWFSSHLPGYPDTDTRRSCASTFRMARRRLYTEG
jgi:hypothetical protein